MLNHNGKHVIRYVMKLHIKHKINDNMTCSTMLINTIGKFSQNKFDI